MLYFVKNDHEINLEWRWGSEGTVSFATSPWRSPRGVGEKSLPLAFFNLEGK